MKEKIEIKVQTIGSLCQQYGLKYRPMRKQLEQVPGLKLEERATRYFNINEVELIYTHLGMPGKQLKAKKKKTKQ